MTGVRNLPILKWHVGVEWDNVFTKRRRGMPANSFVAALKESFVWRVAILKATATIVESWFNLK